MSKEKPNEAERHMLYMKKVADRVDALLEKEFGAGSSKRIVEKLLGVDASTYSLPSVEKSLVEPARYLMSMGGKRLRPALMLTIIEALGKNPEDYMEFSIIPEIIHNSTLVHDDIEDNSATRRNKPALHVQFGLAIANNLGDFGYYYPIITVLDSGKLSGEMKSKLITIYQRDMLKLTIGQGTDLAWGVGAVDLRSITEDNVLGMLYGKTGVLTSMTGKLAATLCGATENVVQAISDFCAALGVGFQLQDDLLNVTESDVSKNKGMIGEDITEGKITLLVIYTLEHASPADKERLIQILRMHTKDQAHIREAIQIMKRYNAHEHTDEVKRKVIDDAWAKLDKALPDSEAKKRLKFLADFAVGRTG